MDVTAMTQTLVPVSSSVELLRAKQCDSNKRRLPGLGGEFTWSDAQYYSRLPP